ncbi:hypothetical protein ES703_17510 [subsurface metagenome]
MAKLVVPSGPLGVSAQRRVEPESRVVSCVAYVKAPATQGFAYTAALGNRLFLKQVRVWFDPWLWTVAESVTFKIYHGVGTPRSYAEISRWQNVLPLLYEGNRDVDFSRYETFAAFEWNMNVLYEGDALRFGIRMDTSPTVSVLYGFVSFQISEG